MQISFSHGGTKQSALIALGHTREETVQADASAQPVADAIVAHVSQSLAGVGDEASVSVSVSASVTIGVAQS